MDMVETFLFLPLSSFVLCISLYLTHSYSLSHSHSRLNILHLVRESLVSKVVCPVLAILAMVETKQLTALYLFTELAS